MTKKEIIGNAILSGDIENAWSDAVMAINWLNNKNKEA